MSQEAVLNVLERYPNGMTSLELSKVMDISRNSIVQNLKKLFENNEINRKLELIRDSHCRRRIPRFFRKSCNVGEKRLELSGFGGPQ